MNGGKFSIHRERIRVQQVTQGVFCIDRLQLDTEEGRERVGKKRTKQIRNAQERKKGPSESYLPAPPTPIPVRMNAPFVAMGP